MREDLQFFARRQGARAAKLSQYWAQNSRLCVECVRLNANRVFFGTLATLPIQLISLLMLWAKAPVDAQEAGGAPACWPHGAARADDPVFQSPPPG